MTLQPALFPIPDPPEPKASALFYVVMARYTGPGWSHGNWKLWPDQFTTYEAAFRASLELNKWWLNRMIVKIDTNQGQVAEPRPVPSPNPAPPPVAGPCTCRTSTDGA